MTKWYQKESNQSAIVTSSILLLISLVSGLYIIYQDNKKLTRELYNEVNGVIINYSIRSKEASKKAFAISLSPDLSSFESTVTTIKNLNKEAETYDNAIHLTEIDRFIKKHGIAETKSEFGKNLNNYHHSHNEANSYLFNILKNEPTKNSVVEYMKIISKRMSGRRDINTYIINLRENDFNF